MKRLLAIFLLTASAGAMAGPYHHHGHYRSGPNGWYWVGPTLIGGIIGYEIARNQQPVIVQQPVVVQPPVVIQNPSVITQQNCSPWTQIQNSDGTITYSRTCSQNGIQ